MKRKKLLKEIKKNKILIRRMKKSVRLNRQKLKFSNDRIERTNLILSFNLSLLDCLKKQNLIDTFKFMLSKKKKRSKRIKPYSFLYVITDETGEKIEKVYRLEPSNVTRNVVEIIQKNEENDDDKN